MFDEVGQVLFLPDSHLRPRVHVLVRVWSRRLPKHVGMLRALHQTITRLLSLQSILTQYIRKAGNSSYWNHQCLYHYLPLLYTPIRLQGFACGRLKSHPLHSNILSDRYVPYHCEFLRRPKS